MMTIVNKIRLNNILYSKYFPWIARFILKLVHMARPKEKFNGRVCSSKDKLVRPRSRKDEHLAS